MDALDEFLRAVYEAHGDLELFRVYKALYTECYKGQRPDEIDWRDIVGDGSLKANPGAKVKRAGRRG